MSRSVTLRGNKQGVHVARLLTFICALFCVPGLWANEAHELYNDLYTVGSGSVLLSYQYIDVRHFQNGADKVPIPEVTAQSLYLEADYAVAYRWRLELGLPYIWKRALPPSPHQPLALDPPRPEVPYIDDGKYRGEFQDFYLGVTYLWIETPVQVEPFFRIIIPSHDYQFFANSAVGQNLWKVEMGLELTHFPLFSNWYYQLSCSYTVVEQTLGVNVNHFRFNAETGYFLTPNFALKVFGISRVGNGQNAQLYPPAARTTENWFEHDRTLKHNSANVGIGAEWFFHEKYQLAANVFTTVWGNSVHWVDFAGDLAVTRYF